MSNTTPTIDAEDVVNEHIILVNRRDVLRTALVLASGLVLPPSIAEHAESVRRAWFLDQTMLGRRESRGFGSWLPGEGPPGCDTLYSPLPERSYGDWLPGPPPVGYVTLRLPLLPNVMVWPLPSEDFAP